MMVWPEGLPHIEPEPPVKRRGHAGTPGKGPEGETCWTCAHLARVRFANTYRKCGLMRDRWTGGPGTDVRAKDPACERWGPIE